MQIIFLFITSTPDLLRSSLIIIDEVRLEHNFSCVLIAWYAVWQGGCCYRRENSHYCFLFHFFVGIFPKIKFIIVISARYRRCGWYTYTGGRAPSADSIELTISMLGLALWKSAEIARGVFRAKNHDSLWRRLATVPLCLCLV